MGGCLALGKSKKNDDNINRNRRVPRTAPRLPQSSSSGASSSNPRNDNLSAVTNAREDNLPNHDSQDSNEFTYLEILNATLNFHKENFLGQGGFGSVYVGYFEKRDLVVAVKQIHWANRGSLQRKTEFDTEVVTLSSTDHPNIVKLHGYCSQGVHRVLVYEYMPLRSLDLHLHEVGPDREALDWNTRMKIAAGVAHGLEYIHTTLDPSIVHCDVKSSNILLEETYQPKLSDFGFSRVGPVAHVATMGTSGYSAPEYAISGHMTVKSDIYSFGVVLLEILTGRKAHDPSKPPNDQSLVNWARPLFKVSKRFEKMADPLMEGVFPKHGFKQAIYIAALCVHEDPTKRQEMSNVAAYLDFLADIPFPPIPLSTIMETSEHSESSSGTIIERDPPNSSSNTAQRELPSSSGNSSGNPTLSEQFFRLVNNILLGDQPSSSGNN